MTLCLLPAIAKAEGGFGAYLAGKQAFSESSFQEAATYFERFLPENPSDLTVVDGLVNSHAAVGDFDSAEPYAKTLADMGNLSQIANMVVMVQTIRAGDWDTAQTYLEQGMTISALVDASVQGWGALADGRMSDAIEAFDAQAEIPGSQAFGVYQKALAYAYVGDFETADSLFAASLEQGMSLNPAAVIAYAQILSQLGRSDDAIAILRRADPMAVNPMGNKMIAQLEAGETFAYSVVSSPSEGLSEVFMSIAVAIAPDAPPAYTLAYAWAAHLLAPTKSNPIIMAADTFAQASRFDMAAQTYALVPEGDPRFIEAELGRAEALETAGQSEAAIEALRNLSRRFPDAPFVLYTLGDHLRRGDHYADAEAAYTKALDMHSSSDDVRQLWFVYFSRGICRERQSNWDDAESDFRKALELRPGHPTVLNYLGYSLIERNEKLDEALDLIEQAIEADPENGAIIDSLGWAMYRMGNYADATPLLERASELEATDPVVNDHLGDAYWQVGRKIEARFQWQRALSFDPAEKDAERIRLKLELGLDAVLERENAPLDGANQ